MGDELGLLKTFLDEDFPMLQAEWEVVQSLTMQSRECVKGWNHFLKKKNDNLEGIIQLIHDCYHRLSIPEKPKGARKDLWELVEEDFLPTVHLLLQKQDEFQLECRRLTDRRNKLARGRIQLKGGHRSFWSDWRLQRQQSRIEEWIIQRENLEKDQRYLLSLHQSMLEVIKEMEQLIRETIGVELDELLMRQNQAAMSWNHRLREAQMKYETLHTEENCFLVFQKWGFEGPIVNAVRVRLAVPAELREIHLPAIPENLDFTARKASTEVEMRWVHYVFWSLAAIGLVILAIAHFHQTPVPEQESLAKSLYFHGSLLREKP